MVRIFDRIELWVETGPEASNWKQPNTWRFEVFSRTCECIIFHIGWFGFTILRGCCAKPEQWIEFDEDDLP